MNEIINVTAIPLELSEGDKQTLDDLSKRIIESHTNTVNFAQLSRDNTRRAIQSAIDTGNYLNTAKKILPFGEFKLWFAQQKFPFSYRCSTNYRELATQERKHSSLIDECTTLRQAYIRCGIITPNKLQAAEMEIPIKEDPEVVETVKPTMPKNKAGEKSKTKYQIAKILVSQLMEVLDHDTTFEGPINEVLQPVVEFYNERLVILDESARDVERGLTERARELAA